MSKDENIKLILSNPLEYLTFRINFAIDLMPFQFSSKEHTLDLLQPNSFEDLRPLIPKYLLLKYQSRSHDHQSIYSFNSASIVFRDCSSLIGFLKIWMKVSYYILHGRFGIPELDLQT